MKWEKIYSHWFAEKKPCGQYRAEAGNHLALCVNRLEDDNLWIPSVEIHDNDSSSKSVVTVAEHEPVKRLRQAKALCESMARWFIYDLGDSFEVAVKDE